jgi:hypothetical protein
LIDPESAICRLSNAAAFERHRQVCIDECLGGPLVAVVIANTFAGADPKVVVPIAEERGAGEAEATEF